MINPQAGLGAMMQASPQPQRGMPTGNMAQTMALAKKMSDSQLAEVLSGKNMDVPQFVAMTEAMGRKQLRTAMDGAQSMGAAKQPSEKQKLLAELQPQPQMQAPMQPPMQGQMPPQAGLAAVPAPNMEPMGHAAGGIIAFSGEDESYVKDRELSPAQLAAEEWAQKLAGMAAPSAPAAPVAPKNPNEISGLEAFGRSILPASVFAPSKSTATSDVVSTDPMGNIAYGGAHIPTTSSGVPVATLKDASVNAMPDQVRGLAPLASAPVAKKETTSGAGNGSAGVAGLKAAAEASQPDDSKRKNYLDDLMSNGEDTQKQIAEMKNQGQGEFLMQLGASLMSTPNLGVALSKGVQAGLPGLAANRKEINALTKDQRDYSLNMAKAQEARQQGNEEQAFKYEQLAVDKAYKVGMVAAYMQRASAGAGTGTAKIDAQQHNAALNKASSQLALAMKDPRMARDLRTPEAQQKYMQDAYSANINLIQGKSGTPSGPQVFAMPGEDGSVLSR
jgi:hypothetical protein